MKEDEAESLLSNANRIIETVEKAEDELQATLRKKKQQSSEQRRREQAAAQEAAEKVALL